MDVYIYDAIRSPRGKGSAKKGALRDLKPIDLLDQMYTAIDNRNPNIGEHIDTIILGMVGQVGDQGSNLAKISSIYHGWNEGVQGVSINTFCASGLTAIGIGAARINSGISEVAVCGGIEMMSRVPMLADKGAWFADPAVAKKTGYTQMGVSADLIATIEDIDREDLDRYAIQSHNRAARATEEGRFQRSLIPIHDGEGNLLLDRDELIRPNQEISKMAELEPLFGAMVSDSVRAKIKEIYNISEINHVHHLGNSPMFGDGSSLLVLASEETGKANGWTPRAKILAFDETSCEPVIMLLGGQLSVEKAVEKAGLHMSDIDIHQFAEAFSATCVKYQKDHDIDPDSFNPNGCTMSMGHAQGSSGAMIVTNLLTELERQDKKIGAAGISGGAGIGAGIVIERI